MAGKSTYKRELSKYALSELIRLYRDVAAQHRAALDEGDYEVANLQAKTIIAAEKEFDRRGVGAKRSLLVLLDDPNIGVRCSVAGYLIDLAPDETIPVLKKIAAMPDSTAAVAAEVVLERNGVPGYKLLGFEDDE